MKLYHPVLKRTICVPAVKQAQHLIVEGGWEPAADDDTDGNEKETEQETEQEK